MSTCCVSIVSQGLVTAADSKSPPSIRLSAADLTMLPMQYAQVGFLFSGKAPTSLSDHLKYSLSKVLSIFPPLAGRLFTDSGTGHISIICSNAGALLIHARASSLRLNDVCAGEFPQALFALNRSINFDGHSDPIAAVQFTELADSLFIACSINHAVVDGISFFHFFNTFAEIFRRGTTSLPPPSFSRGPDNAFFTDAAIQFPGGRPTANLVNHEPVKAQTFRFSRRSISAMKQRANEWRMNENNRDNDNNNVISSFQSLCAVLWRSITRARKLAPSTTTSFRMLVNCRGRVNPKMDPWYFGSAVQNLKTTASTGEVVTRELGWSADLLHRKVVGHDDQAVRKAVREWERSPLSFPFGNLDNKSITVGSSPWFPAYDNDFGWGRPVAVRSGNANKTDGKVMVFPGRDGDGCMDVTVWLKLASMAALENDPEFVYYLNLNSAL